MTNGDKIRKMTDEELSIFLNRIIEHCREEYCNPECPLYECCARDSFYQEIWLEKEAE